MRSRRLALPLAAALGLPLGGLLGAALAVVPSIATGTSPPNTASFRAIDYAWQANGGSGSTATIVAGGTVTISYPSGQSEHNADFGNGPPPTGCAQTAGPSSGPVPPLPDQPTSPGWSGTCTFKTPGTYTFHCDLHPFMTATVTVKASPPPTTSTTTATGTTTTTGTTTGPTTTGTTTATGTTTSSPTTVTSVPPPPEPTVTIVAPPAVLAAAGFAIGAVQHGPALHASMTISRAGAGGRLDVYVFAAPRSLTSRDRRWTRVGRLVRTSLAAGVAGFSVPLGPAARRALRRHRLAVVVGVIVRSPGAATAWTIRRVVVDRAA